jgi:hypothetical protein
MINNHEELLPRRVKATDVQVGDVVVELSEVDYRVKSVSRVNHIGIPADVRSRGGWVSIVGDSDDNYFTKYYGGEEDYYALPTQMINVLRTK